MGFWHLRISCSVRCNVSFENLFMGKNNGRQEGKWYIPKPVESRLIQCQGRAEGNSRLRKAFDMRNC